VGTKTYAEKTSSEAIESARFIPAEEESSNSQGEKEKRKSLSNKKVKRDATSLSRLLGQRKGRKTSPCCLVGGKEE